ncbi:hypothetical protein [Streptomyces sp. cmx-4-7]|uniref:hypothetical protein n=1 Tax=Streptomyces sp. cmx-4-7 TaxID=2790939 RepID=UPI00397FE227
MAEAVPPPSAAAGARRLPSQGVRNRALPPLPPLGPHGVAPVLDAVTAEPPAPLPELAVLRALARDAARRAAALLQGHVPEAHDTVTDIVRFTVGTSGAHLETAAAHLGLTPLRMRHLTAAYHHGGPHGAAVCLSPRPADPAALAGAKPRSGPCAPSPTSPSSVVTTGSPIRPPECSCATDRTGAGTRTPTATAAGSRSPGRTGTPPARTRPPASPCGSTADHGGACGSAAGVTGQ